MYTHIHHAGLVLPLPVPRNENKALRSRMTCFFDGDLWMDRRCVCVYHTGLFCRCTGLFCRCTGLFSAQQNDVLFGWWCLDRPQVSCKALLQMYTALLRIYKALLVVFSRWTAGVSAFKYGSFMDIQVSRKCGGLVLLCRALLRSYRALVRNHSVPVRINWACFHHTATHCNTLQNIWMRGTCNRNKWDRKRATECSTL